LPASPRPPRLAALAVVVVLGVATVGVPACNRTGVPTRLAGLHRGRVFNGESATRMMAELHGRSVAPNTASVAEYGPKAELKLWVARFPGDSQADRALAAMLVGIRTRGGDFTPPRRTSSFPGRWFCFGPGGHHLFWTSGPSLYWLTGEAETLERAVAELPLPAQGNWT
jgi:hypothetical protein